MPVTIPTAHRAVALIVALAFSTTAAPARAQVGPDEFVTGAAAAAWENWQTAMAALIARDADTAEFAFDQLMQGEPSAFRVALLAEKTTRQTSLAGGVLLLEQDHEAGSLQEAGTAAAELLMVGREQVNEADDGFYFASIGQFDVANANFQALISADPDPVALLEFVDRVPRRHQILVQLSDHPLLGGSVQELMRRLQQGEQAIKADPMRIKQNIERLAGPPRAYENGVALLKESGEYSVAFLITYLRDPDKRDFIQPILRTLPQIGRPALNPLVQSLQMTDQATQQSMIRALGQIGYRQAVPYLLRLRENSATPPDVRAAVDAALSDLSAQGAGAAGGETAAQAFYSLAEGYYNGTESLAADTTLDYANIWYWQDDLLENIQIPTEVFDEIMTMRCCEAALDLNPDMKPALALWLAANFRREAQLPEGAPDFTRPENYPPAVYFAQSAGAEYCQLALARAVEDRDPAVALGAIAALRGTAGSANLLGETGGTQPLAEALTFPDRMVRIRAAFALGASLPASAFHNSQNLLPVLNEALQLFGGTSHALVIDPDTESANAMLTALRDAGYEGLSDVGVFTGLEKARRDLPSVDVIVLASDVANPDMQGALQAIRSEYQFASAPVLIIRKPGQADAVDALVRASAGVGVISPEVETDTLNSAIASAARAFGTTPLTPDVGLAVALESAEVLRGLAAANNPLFNPAAVEAALLNAFEAGNDALRLATARVLAHIGTEKAQGALARAALDNMLAGELRIELFGILAESGRRTGLHLPSAMVQDLVELVESADDMAIRQAASQAMGALNFPGNPASVIIRNQSRG